MISWRALLAAAQPLAVVPVEEQFLDLAIVRLGGVKLPLRGPHRFRYPKHVDALSPLRDALVAASAFSPTEAVLLSALLRNPLRAYPMGGSAPAYALLGAWRVDDLVEPRIAVLSPTDGGIAIDTTTYAVGETHEEFLATMERLYLDLDRDARESSDPTRGSRDRVLWIGGSVAEADDPIWRDRIEAVLMTEGFGCTILERPGRDPAATNRAVSEYSGAGVVYWIPRLGSAALPETIRARTSLRCVGLEEYEFSEALEELRLSFEAEPLEEGAPSEAADDATSFESGGPYYFKKIAKRGRGVDLVIHRREPCVHDSWTVVQGAPQARKGIERASGLSIRKLEHCDRCTGGGMWRVHLD